VLLEEVAASVEILTEALLIRTDELGQHLLVIQKGCPQ
jgi:hypothetical protein